MLSWRAVDTDRVKERGRLSSSRYSLAPKCYRLWLGLGRPKENLLDSNLDWGNPDNNGDTFCIPPFGLMCIRASGWLISKRRPSTQKLTWLIITLNPFNTGKKALLAWLHKSGWMCNFRMTIFRENDGLTTEEKTEQIVHLWHSRTCTPEGQIAAGVIADFLTFEVHPESSIPLVTLSMTDNNPANIPYRTSCKQSKQIYIQQRLWLPRWSCLIILLMLILLFNHNIAVWF